MPPIVGCPQPCCLKVTVGVGFGVGVRTSIPFHCTIVTSSCHVSHVLSHDLEKSLEDPDERQIPKSMNDKIDLQEKILR